MTTAQQMKAAQRISDLELYELVVAMYPEKFAVRNEKGEDLWDEVMQFVDDDLCGNLLQDEQGLRELIGRILRLTNPIQSGLTGKLYHALGPVEVNGDHAQMLAVAKCEVVPAAAIPDINSNAEIKIP